MAVNYFMFSTKLNTRSPDDITTDVTTGGTLTGSGAVVEIVFDEEVFTSANGKKRLILSLETMLNYLKQSSTTWPLT